MDRRHIPTLIEALLVEGQAALDERRVEAALEAFDAVLAIDPENARASQGHEEAVLLRSILERRAQP